MSRISWNEYFMQIAHIVATRSTCLRRQVGAVAVLDKRILATGYNGAVKSIPHCSERKCLREELGIPSGQREEICWAVHAEQNVIVQAATFGVSLAGATLYCTHQPCLTCTKMLINCGIHDIYYSIPYPDEHKLAKEMIDMSYVTLHYLPMEKQNENYFN